MAQQMTACWELDDSRETLSLHNLRNLSFLTT